MENLAISVRNKWASLSSLQQRIITALILGPLLLAAIVVGGPLFTFIVAAGGIFSAREWLVLVEKPLPQQVRYAYLGTIGLTVLLAYFLPLKWVLLSLLIWPFALNELSKREQIFLNKWAFAGIFYLGLPCACIIWLRKNGLIFSSYDWAAVMLLFLQIWATDIGAYFVGRRLGGPKLAPVVSPNKTWSGLFGGMAASSLVTGLFAGLWGFNFWAAYFVVGLLLAVIAQGGDLFESFVKRRAGVKDSGGLIPGHGGMLDRIDALLMTAPFYALTAALLA